MYSGLEEKQFDKRGALGPFLKRIFQYSLRYKKWLYAFCFWVGIVAIVDAAFPLVVLNLIDLELSPQLIAMREAISSGNNYEIEWQGIAKFGLIFLALGILQAIAVRYFVLQAGKLQEHVLYDLRKEMFEKFQKLQASFYDKNASGWLLTRMSSDCDRVTELISWGTVDLIWGIVMIFACLGALSIYSIKLAILVGVSIPILTLVSFRVRMLVLKWSRRSRKLNSDITAVFNERISGVDQVKASAREDEDERQFSGLSFSMRKASFRASAYTAVYAPLVILVGSMAAAAVIFIGGQDALVYGITVGLLAASFEYATRIFLPIMDISRFYALAQGSLSAGERIFSLIDEPIEILNNEKPESFEGLKRELHFDQVHFHYDENKPVIKGLDLKVKAGSSVAIVGPTGEGKSTLVKLVGRYYDVQGGAIRLDGTDVREIDLHELRSKMGVVLQEPQLFEGTVADNIAFAKPDASLEEIKACLLKLGASELIERLTEEVGEGGSRLSDGERQMVSFARALIADPSILIMDEATSSVDAWTESKIQEGIKTLLEGRTSLIIAHRLSTIKHCDEIILISDGQIGERGSHDSLMQLKGRYWKLYSQI
jgi:ATP-binding cassette subfamily B protein